MDPLLAPVMAVVRGRVVPCCSEACRREAQRADDPAPAPSSAAEGGPREAPGNVASPRETALAETPAAAGGTPHGASGRLLDRRTALLVGLGILAVAGSVALSQVRGFFSSDSAEAPIPLSEARLRSPVDRSPRRVPPFDRDAAVAGRARAHPASTHLGPRTSARFRFAVLSDLHVGGRLGGAQQAVRKSVTAVLEIVRPAFVIVPGDLIDIRYGQEPIRPAVVWSMWRRFDKQVTQRLRAAGIGLFPTPGNHDVNSAWPLYRRYWSTHHNPGVRVRGLAGYRSYYSFDVQHTHFVSLVAPGTRWLDRRPQQLAWLAEDLRQARARGQRIFITFAHSPLFCPRLNYRCNRDMAWLSDPQLLALLKSVKATHIGGHMHVFDDRVHRGVRSIIAGVIGKGARRVMALPKAQRRGFLVVDVLQGGIRVHRVTYPGLDHASLPPSPAYRLPPGR